jgi:hypothetical protein
MKVISFPAVLVRLILLLGVLFCSVKCNAQSYNFESVELSGMALLPAHPRDGLPPAFRQVRFVVLQPQPAFFSEPGADMRTDDSRNSSAPAFQMDDNNETPGVDYEIPHSKNDFMVSQECADGELSGKDCRFRWLPALGEQGEFLAIETSWNLVQNRWVRYWTFRGDFWHNYFLTLKNYRFSRWSDDNPIYDDYVGHPMMGAITMDIFIQNDPRGMSLELENSKEYWHSRLWALLWSTVYSAEWKLGPISESSIGNQGIGYYFDDHKWTNGTGTVGLVVTPIGGWVWSMAEDMVDKHVIRRIETKSSNRLYLFSIQFLNPCRGFSNLLRFKAPWYRDSRPVRAGNPN